MPSDVENPEKSMEKDSDKKEKKSMEKDKDKKKKTRNSFLRSLKDSLTVKGLEKYENEDDKKVPGSGNGKVKYTIDVNTTGKKRSAIVWIAGYDVKITQAN